VTLSIYGWWINDFIAPLVAADTIAFMGVVVGVFLLYKGVRQYQQSKISVATKPPNLLEASPEQISPHEIASLDSSSLSLTTLNSNQQQQVTSVSLANDEEQKSILSTQRIVEQSTNRNSFWEQQPIVDKSASLSSDSENIEDKQLPTENAATMG